VKYLCTFAFSSETGTETYSSAIEISLKIA
jgi:hypothetical protein